MVEKLQILSYKLNDRQIKELAQKISNDLSVPQDVIYALIKQESWGKVYAKRFELHKYNYYISKWYPENIARLLSTSYGLFQIMWFNYKKCWWRDINSFVSDLMNPDPKIAIKNQIRAFENFVKSNKSLLTAMEEENWQQIARYYNGPANIQNYAMAIKNLSEQMAA